MRYIPIGLIMGLVVTFVFSGLASFIVFDLSFMTKFLIKGDAFGASQKIVFIIASGFYQWDWIQYQKSRGR